MTEYEALYLLWFMCKYLFLPMGLICLIAEVIEKYFSKRPEPWDWYTRLENGEELVGGDKGNLFRFDK